MQLSIKRDTRVEQRMIKMFSKFSCVLSKIKKLNLKTPYELLSMNRIIGPLTNTDANERCTKEIGPSNTHTTYY